MARLGSAVLPRRGAPLAGSARNELAGAMHYIGSLVHILWLIIGAVAAGQRHDYTHPPARELQPGGHDRRDDPRGAGELSRCQSEDLLPAPATAQQVSHYRNGPRPPAAVIGDAACTGTHGQGCFQASEAARIGGSCRAPAAIRRAGPPAGRSAAPARHTALHASPRLALNLGARAHRTAGPSGLVPSGRLRMRRKRTSTGQCPLSGAGTVLVSGHARPVHGLRPAIARHRRWRRTLRRRAASTSAGSGRAARQPRGHRQAAPGRSQRGGDRAARRY